MAATWNDTRAQFFNYTEKDFVVITSPTSALSTEVIIRVVTIVVIMLLTLTGNIALVSGITCLSRLRRKSRVNVFLVNLAIADLMVCIFTMTTEIFFIAFGQWILGAVACKLVVYGQIVTLASTTFLLTAMSIDRYQVLVQPFKSLRGQPSVRRKVVVAWVLAFIFATPQLFIFVQTKTTIESEGGRVVYACRSRGYTAEWQRKVYFSFLTIYILVIPTLVMTFCYLNIIRAVWMRGGGTRSGGGGGGKRDSNPLLVHYVTAKTRRLDRFNARSTASYRPNTPRLDASGSYQTVVTFGIPKKVVSSSKRNVIKMTLSVIVCFVVCWTPYFVVSLIRIYSNYKIEWRHLLSVCELMALAHSALNPLLYGLFSTKTLRLGCSRLRLRFCGTRRSNSNVSPADSLLLSEFNQAALLWSAEARLHRRRCNDGACNSSYHPPSLASGSRRTNSSNVRESSTDSFQTHALVEKLDSSRRCRSSVPEQVGLLTDGNKSSNEPSWTRPRSSCDGYGTYVHWGTSDGRQFLSKQKYSESQRTDLASATIQRSPPTTNKPPP